MAVAWLKHKYVIGRGYKNQRAKLRTNQSMGANKRGGKKPTPLMGTPVMIVNMSENIQYCAGSGRILPKRGMAIRHNGALYVSRNSIPA